MILRRLATPTMILLGCLGTVGSTQAGLPDWSGQWENVGATPDATGGFNQSLEQVLKTLQWGPPNKPEVQARVDRIVTTEHKRLEAIARGEDPGGAARACTFGFRRPGEGFYARGAMADAKKPPPPPEDPIEVKCPTCRERVLVAKRDAVERGIHLFLLFDVFDNGFNDDVAIGEVRLIGRALEASADRVFLLRRDAALLRRTLGKLR